MKRIAILWMCLALLLAPTALAEGAQLTVQGTGLVSLKADRVTVSIGVQAHAEDVMTAQKQANESIAAVIEALVEAGIAREDIHTDTISIYSEYDYDTDVIGSYTAYNNLSATTSDTENAGVYIDAAFAAGANQLNNVQFFSSDTSEAGRKALALAVENAEEKAAVLAEAAGMKLGSIVSVQERGCDDYYGNPMIYAKEAAEEDAGSGTQVFAAQLSVTANVTVVYELIQE